MRLVKACMYAKSLQSCPVLCDPIVAHQATLSIGFSRQEYWSGMPCPPPGDHPHPWMKPMSLMSFEMTGRFFTTSTTWEAQAEHQLVQFSRSVVSASLQPHESQHARPPCPSSTHRIYPNSCHWISDTIWPSYLLSSPSPPALNLSQHQGLFQRVSSSHQVAKVLEFQLQHQSYQWTPRTDLL